MIRTLLTLLMLPLLLALGGCLAIPKKGGPFTNHLTVTVDMQSCLTASRWGPMALTGDLNESECEAILQGLQLLMIQRAPAQAAAQAGADATPSPAARGVAGRK